MRFRHNVRATLALVLAFSIACPPARALIALNDGHDHIFVTGSVSVGWDSNVYANSDSAADHLVSSTILAEYTRRAGWIGVNASAALDATRYGDLETENFDNPRFTAELTKQTGRTTGSLTLSAARASRADAAVNLRSTSWNYGSGLNFRYPIVSIYTLSGHVGYSYVNYIADSFLPDLRTYTAGADLIRLFSSDRDVMLGYRYRHSRTTALAAQLVGGSPAGSMYDDHSVTVGMSGKLIRGINGNLRAGYQVRTPRGGADSRQGGSTYHSWTASGSATYALNKRVNFTGTLGKDFVTTATDMSVDTTTASLDAQYAYSSRWSFSGTLSTGDSRFLGNSRHDNFLTASASANYSLNEHLKVAATYAWFKNWSTLDFADFVRSSYTVNVSSRW